MADYPKKDHKGTAPPTKLTKGKAPTGQPFSFPIETFPSPAPSRVERTPIGIKTNTRYNSDNSTNDCSQARETRFKKS